MHKISRRTMLCRSAQAAAAAAMASTFAPLLAAPPSRWFKIGACDWSLGKRCNPAAFDVAKELGLDGVQVQLGTPKLPHLRQPDVQKAYREAAKRTGLEIASLFFGDFNAVPLKSDPQAAEGLTQGIDVCKALGLTVAMAAFFGKNALDMSKTDEIDRLVEVLRKVAPAAEKQGVAIGLESYLSADENRKLLDRIGSPAVRVYYDVGNSAAKGRDVAQEIRALGKLICEFHAKDGPHVLGEGRIDFHKVREAIDDIGYSGWIQIEADTPHGLKVDYPADAKFLRSIFPAQG